MKAAAFCTASCLWCHIKLAASFRAAALFFLPSEQAAQVATRWVRTGNWPEGLGLTLFNNGLLLWELQAAVRLPVFGASIPTAHCEWPYMLAA